MSTLPSAALTSGSALVHLVPPMFTFQLGFCVFFQLSCIKSEALIAAVLRAASMMGEHPWLVVLRRQRSRFTLLILTILCWRGVAKQPQGNEWDSNSGDLQKCSQNTAHALLRLLSLAYVDILDLFIFDCVTLTVKRQMIELIVQIFLCFRWF